MEEIDCHAQKLVLMLYPQYDVWYKEDNTVNRLGFTFLNSDCRLRNEKTGVRRQQSESIHLRLRIKKQE